jgi:hypothetical protein
VISLLPYSVDRTGFFSADDLKALMNTLYGVSGLHPDTVVGNAKSSWRKLRLPGDDKIDFKEFNNINNQFPHLFKPAFRFQQQMTIYIMGESWWEKKVYHNMPLLAYP